MSVVNSIVQSLTDSDDIKINSYDHIKPKAIENFLKMLSVSKIKELSNKFKPIEVQGKVSHKKFINIMNELFVDSYMYHSLYELIFSRFKLLKCSVLSHREKSFMTKIISEDEISAYEICCALTIFITCDFKEKLKLLFDLTDIDEDGYLNEEEIVRLISTLNYLFCNEEKQIPSNSTIINQSLANIRIKENLNMLMFKPGELKKVLKTDIYVDFDTFYERLSRIPFYKFKIIPTFVNFRNCLNVDKQEQGIDVNRKIKDEFIKISTDILSSIKITPNKNEDLKFKYPPKRNKDNVFNSDYVNANKQRNVKRETQIPKLNLQKLSRPFVKTSTLNTNANTITENASSNRATIPNETIDRPYQPRRGSVAMRYKQSMRSLIFKSMQDKQGITCNYEKIRNIEIYPALIKVFTSRTEGNEADNNDLSIYGNGYERKYHFLKRPLMNKDLTKKHYRYLTNNELLSEIEILSNRNKGEEYNEKMMVDIHSDVKEEALTMRNHLKGQNKYDNKIIFGKYKDIKISINHK